MNCVNISGNFVNKGVGQLLQANRAVGAQQIRTTFVLKRRNPPPLVRKGSKPPPMRSRHFIYDLIEDTDVRPRPPLNLILTQFVDTIGDRGTRISVPPLKAYTKFLLPGLAVYDTPDNSKKYVREDREKKTEYSSIYAPRTINVLKNLIVSVKMSNETPWTLEPWHIRSAFRASGVHLREDCITMPDHVISGPNHDFENREFYVIITLNKKEQTPVRCRIHHHSNNIIAQKNIPATTVDFWTEMVEPIFPEDKVVLDKLPVPWFVQKEMAKNIKPETPL